MKTFQFKSQQKMQALKHKLKHFTPHRLVKNQSAVSAVISNMILIAAVIVVGFVALGYARSMSADYQTDYGDTVSSDIGKLKETMAFQYCQYNSTTKQLTVYLLNSGTVNIEIKNVFINTAPVTNFSAYRMNDFQAITNHIIGSGIDAYLVLDLTGITLPSGTSNIKILTGSDSNFACTFLP